MKLFNSISRYETVAVRRHLLLGENRVELISQSRGAMALISETFFPDGMLNVRAGDGSMPSDTQFIDYPAEPEEMNELFEYARSELRETTFELTRAFRQRRFDGDGLSVFVLRDSNEVDETATAVVAGRRVMIVRPRSELGDRWLTRLVRDLATREGKAAGALVLHASAFRTGRGAVLVVGDSGAGKSTTSIALARLQKSRSWMGNDRMHIRGDEEGMHAIACPLPLAINRGTLDSLGGIDYTSWKPRAGLPGPDSDWDEYKGEDKLKLSSREVHDFLGVSVAAQAPVAGLILPQIQLGVPAEISFASSGFALDVVRRNCFSLDDNLYGEDWLGLTTTESAPVFSVKAFLSELPVPAIRATIGGAEGFATVSSQLADLGLE